MPNMHLSPFALTANSGIRKAVKKEANTVLLSYWPMNNTGYLS